MTRHRLGLVLLATVAGLPLTLRAQEQANGAFDISDAPPAAAEALKSDIPASRRGEITLGVGGVSDTSDVFGRYTGQRKSGAGEISAFGIERRDAWDSGGTRFLSFTGVDVDSGWGEVLPEARIAFKVGSQGHWWVSGEYSAMTYTASDHFTTILQTDGQLAPGYLAALTANGAFLTNSTTPNAPGASFYGTSYKASASTGIASSAGNHVALYGPQNELTLLVGTRRDRGTIATGLEAKGWTLTTGLSHEHKAGSLEQAMTTGGNNAGMMTFAMPIDYDTDIFSTSAAYSARKLQASLAYELSSFTDNARGGYAFQGWNFTNVKDPVSGLYTSYQLSGVYSLPPSNQAHTLTAALGYSPNSATRLNATLVYGLQLQDEPFAAVTQNAYTLNVGGVAGHNTKGAPAAPLGLNPVSLRGFVETWFGSASVYTRTGRALDLRLAYSVDVRDPHTQSVWVYGDPTDAVQNSLNIKYRQAVPESWTKQALTATAGLRLGSRTRLNLDYTLRDARRGNAITHHTTDHEASARLETTFPENVTLSLAYAHAERTASAPDFSLWLVQIPADCGATLATLGCQQVPFYEAARTEDRVTGILTAALNPRTAFSFYTKYDANTYHLPAAVYGGVTVPSVGVNRAHAFQIAPDLTYQLDDDNSTHVYYTFVRTYRDMRALNNQSVIGGGPYYEVATTYDIHTAGVNFTHKINRKIKLVADYIYSFGNIGFNQSGTWDNNEAGQAFGGDPTLSTRSDEHQVKLHTVIDWSSRLSMYLGYRFDSLDTTDWALTGASVGQVLTGDIPARYNVHSVRAAVTWRF